MGWYYGYNQTRASVIEELTPAEKVSEGGTFKTLRKFTSGNTLWTVHETTLNGAEPERWIGCYLLSRGTGDGWGYKPMEESMHPYYYSCPLAFLDEVPETSRGANPKWREGVRKYHAERNARLAARRARRKAWRAERGLQPRR